VIDDESRVVGVITDRDICMAAYLNNRSPYDLDVGDFMSHQVLVCHPRDRIADVTATMRRAQVRRLPVTDEDGRLVGILSLADIARMADGAAESTGPASAVLDVGRTLGAVGKPRGRGLPLSG
jgi:predicted transcriptional regulator